MTSLLFFTKPSIFGYVCDMIDRGFSCGGTETTGNITCPNRKEFANDSLGGLIGITSSRSSDCCPAKSRRWQAGGRSSLEASISKISFRGTPRWNAGVGLHQVGCAGRDVDDSGARAKPGLALPTPRLNKEQKPSPNSVDPWQKKQIYLS